VRFRFRGTGLRVVGLKCPYAGFLEISVDHMVTTERVNLYSPEWESGQVLWESTQALAGGDAVHEVLIVATGSGGDPWEESVGFVGIEEIEIRGTEVMRPEGPEDDWFLRHSWR